MQEKEINIVALNDRDSCQTRQGMYAGSNDNCNTLLREAVDNALDEVYGCSYCDTITLKDDYPDGIRVVSDNGRCIPIKWDEDHQMTKCEMATSILHAGSKFSNAEGDMSIGANGVGISVTNFLSFEFFILSRIKNENYSDSIREVADLYKSSKDKSNLYYVLHYHDGLKVGEYAMKKKDAINLMDSTLQVGVEFPDNASTIVVFKPHPERFVSVESEYPITNLRNAYVVLDKFYKKKLNFYLNGELQSAIYTPQTYEFTTKVKVGDRSADFYVSFGIDSLLNIIDITGSVNSLKVNAGLHIQAARQAYEKALRSVYGITHNSIINGLHMDVFTVASFVDYTSQVKSTLSKLDNLTLNDIVKVLEPEFRKIIKSHPEVFDVHVERLNQYSASLEKISAIQQVKNLISTTSGNSNKIRSKIRGVRDAAGNKRSNCTLYICEGKSAASNIINVRNPQYDAIFELRGIVKNAVGISLEELLKNEEAKNLVNCLACGVNAYHDKSKLRYGRICLVCDNDADGRGKISSGVLGIIAAQMTFLFDMGVVYIVDTPLYKQNGKYFYIDDLSGLDLSKPAERFKGIGSLTEEDSRECITGPNAKLIQITSENYKYAMELLSSSNARKELMIKNGIITDPYHTGIL